MQNMIMTSTELENFLGKLSRAEFEDNPIIFSKAIRVSLIALGYDEEWVNDDFRTRLEKEYEYFFDEYANRKNKF